MVADDAMPIKPQTITALQRRARPQVYGRAPSDRAYDVHRRRDPVQATADRLRHSRRWRAVRLQKLRLDPVCETCMAEGYTRLATDVNHRVPVRVLVERGTTQDVFAMENLESLCRSHHNRVTARETAERRAATIERVSNGNQHGVK